MLINLSSIIAISLLVFFDLGAAQEICAPCTSRTNPLSKQGEYETPEVQIMWFSDADKYGDDNNHKDWYCYERIIKNKHEIKPLRFDWPLGRMSSRALSPGGKAKYCQTWGLYKSSATIGPLYYGRSGNYLNTQVWEAQDEPPAPTLTGWLRNGGAEQESMESTEVKSTQVATSFEMDLFFHERTEKISLFLNSSFEQQQSEKYMVNYEIINLQATETNYRFDWSFVTGNPEFIEKVKELQLKSNARPGYIIPIKNISFNVTTYSTPNLELNNLTVYFPNGEEAARVVVPTYSFTRSKKEAGK